MGQRSPDSSVVVYWLVVDFETFMSRFKQGGEEIAGVVRRELAKVGAS